jgi:hypothetical protein
MSLEKLVFRQGANKSRAHQRSCCAVMQVAARATGHMTHLGRRVCIAAVETMLIFAKDAGAMPSVLAVCRSMTDSNLVGCGRSRDSREPQRSGENSCRLHGGGDRAAGAGLLSRRRRQGDRAQAGRAQCQRYSRDDRDHGASRVIPPPLPTAERFIDLQYLEAAGIR